MKYFNIVYTRTNFGVFFLSLFRVHQFLANIMNFLAAQAEGLYHHEKGASPV